MSAAALTHGSYAASTRRRPARPAPSALRLTRRGRLTVLLLVSVLLLAAAVAVGSSVVATSGAGDPLEVRTVTVQPGQTLWDIAVANGAAGDPRDTVHEIEQLNHLDGAELQIGQTLDVPVAD